MIIRVRNWEKFQHYRHRNPPWIKLHRSVLDDDVFQSLMGDDAKLLINLWLIASECDGAIKTTPRLLAWRLRVASTRSVSNGLTRLATALFVTLTDDVGNVLAECLQDASETLDRVEESRGRVEAETETEKNLPLPLPVEPTPAPVAPRAGKPTWLTPYLDLHAKHVGDIAPSRLAKVVAPVREAAGDEAAIYAFAGWCNDPKRSKSINGFRDRWRDYENFEIFDGDGNLTERGAAYAKANGL